MPRPPLPIPSFMHQAGRTDRVPEPWTPVRVTGETLACWGRTHALDGHPLPARITSQSQELLARPIGLSATVDGHALRWRKCESSPVARHPHGRWASRTATGRCGKLLFTSRVTLYYDGVLRVQVEAMPLEPVDLDGLAVDIPIKRSQARFLFAPFAGAVRVDDLPARGAHGEFTPLVWTGTDEVGLGWGGASDEMWDRGDRALALLPRGNALVLRMQVVQARRRLTAPLRFEFGLQANPWRPPAPGAHRYRNVHLQRAYDLSEADLRAWYAKGARTIIYHSDWSDLHAYPETRDKARLHALVRRCHNVGLELLVYFGKELSSGAPEWPVWGENWRLMVDGRRQEHGYVPYRPPHDPAFHMCPVSGWQDFIVAGIEHVMRTYGLDGVYLDGFPSWTGPCGNALHGCGYTLADGTRRAAAPLWADRELMERVYVAVRSVKPGARVSIHANPGPCCFSAHFATDCFGGEQYGGDFRKAGLDSVRAFHIGTPQWGVASDIISYASFEFALAVGLLHGVLPRPGTQSAYHNSLLTSVWAVQDAFGCLRADWRPYWTNASLVRAAPECVRASLWNRPGKGMLLVLANLASDETRATVSLSRKRLGCGPGRLEALDMLPCDAPLSVNGSRIEALVPAERARLLFVAPAGERAARGRSRRKGATLWPRMRRCANAISLSEDLQVAVDEWLVLGPFAPAYGDERTDLKGHADVPADYRGMETAHVDESAPLDPPAPPAGAGPWRKLRATEHQANIRPDVAADHWCVVYAYTRLQFPHLVPLTEENPVDLHIPVFHAIRVWVNGEPVFAHGGAGAPRYGQGRAEPARVRAILHPGWNPVLIKMVTRRSARFRFLVTEPEADEPHPLVKIQAADEPGG